MNLVKNIKNAVHWFENNSTDECVYISSKQRIPYYEVSGYYIPTLKSLGFTEKAKKFCNYLCDHQNSDGSWGLGGDGYVFDTAQVIDGLSEFPGYTKEIAKAHDWILSKYKNGKFYDPNLGHPEIPESFNYRVLWPLKKAGFDISHFSEFMANSGPYEFISNAHFYGYVFEGMARLGMDVSPFIKIAKSFDGKIPAKKEMVNEYCFTGLSQFALSLFLSGMPKLGMQMLEFVSGFQNESGGFYGGTPGSGYFIDEEPSWAVKFYIDAFLESSRASFVDSSDTRMLDFEGSVDPRFFFVKSRVEAAHKVLDVGCGGGRYINNLDCDRYACDLVQSQSVNAKFSIGSCYDLPYNDDFFDVVICCECLEHAIFKENAIKQMLRVVKPGGRLLIIDKDVKEQADYQYPLHYGEEWVDFDVIKRMPGSSVMELSHPSFAMKFYGASIPK